MTEREKTNSVTHLVKIIVQEEISRVYKDTEERFRKLESYKTINAGDFWNGFEHQTFTEQVETFVCRAARTHGRTEGAIRARLKDYMNGKYESEWR